MKRLLHMAAVAARLAAGGVFVFSGLVKAVDPLGSTYKFVDYFQAFHLPGLEPAAFALSVLLSSLEFVVGMCLLLFIQHRWANWGALLFMAFFTPLTLWLAVENPVKDCGCFGDALVLTNWQTFYKNLVISALVGLSFFYRHSQKDWLSAQSQWLLTGFILLAVFNFTWYNYQHLPLMDFRPYKVGTNIREAMMVPEGAPTDVYEQYITLQDRASGRSLAVESAVYTRDSSYWGRGSSWKYVAMSEPRLVRRGYRPPVQGFSITSLAGDDVTQAVLADSGYYFILVAYNLEGTRTKPQDAINELYRQAVGHRHRFICLTSASEAGINGFKARWRAPYDFYRTDPVVLKTMIRSNPGLILLRRGTILAKWHSNDIPDYPTIENKYVKPGKRASL